MKTLVVVAAGAADRPLEDLGRRTPLESAATPVLDQIAREGRLGCILPAPEGMRAEEGAFALALFGLDPLSYGEAGATLSAAAFDVPIGPQDRALRLSLVTADDKTIFDPTAGQISRDEAGLLLAALDGALEDDTLSLHLGTGLCNLLLWKGARDVPLTTVPPYDVAAGKLSAAQPKGAGTGPLRAAIALSAELLATHEVNELRADLGENPANLIWPWGPGVSVPLPDFTTRTGAEASLVGVHPTVVGAARLQGIETLRPEGATGLPRTNLRAKTKAALAALEERDLVYLHVDALAAASHARDFVAKVETLERIDGYVLGPLMRAIEAGLQAHLVVIGGPAVSAETGRHLPDPVPLAIYGPGIRSHGRGAFTEVAARDAGFQVERPHELLEFLLHLPD